MIRADVLRPGDVAVLQSVCLRAYRGVYAILRGESPNEETARRLLRREIVWWIDRELYWRNPTSPTGLALHRLRDAATEARRMGV